MKKCQSCGFDMPDDVNVCGNCGKYSLSRKPQPEWKPKQTKKCQNCGFEVPDDYIVCGNCGNPIGTQPTAPARKPGCVTASKIVGGFVIVLVIVSIIVFISKYGYLKDGLKGMDAAIICQGNQRTLAATQGTYYLEHKSTTTNLNDLLPYIPGGVKCPSGGAYIADPSDHFIWRCSIGEHNSR